MFTAEKGIYEGLGYDIVIMKGAGHEVRILPVNGFNLYDWTYEGKEILMKPADITVFGTKYGVPILFPTPDLMKNSTYTWEGKTYVMKKRGVPVRNHGIVKDEPFTVTEIFADEHCARCSGKIEIRKEGSVFEGWPWNCTLHITYTLDAAGVHAQMKIINEDETGMPFGLALHPYFSKRGDANKCFIKVPAKRYYEVDEALFPSGRILPAEGGYVLYDDFHTVESLDLDNVFRGMTADMESQVMYDAVVVHIHGSDCFRNVVVFTPHDRAGFCIEPQTSATDCLNMLAAGLIDESGVMVIPAGRAFECEAHMTVTKR